MAAPPFKVKAIFDYASGIEEDLSFQNGQIITVTGEEDADWYEGEILEISGSRRVGLFPKNFVQIYEPETPPRPSRASRAKNEVLSSVTPNAGEQSSRTGQEDMIRNQPASALPQTLENKHDRDSNAPGSREPENMLQAVKGPAIQSLNRAASSTTKPVNSTNGKSLSPPVAEKPLTGSFRDRIAAFNKPAAPPVAPAKPGSLGSSGGGFIKKAFVAPPPSKNAYVAPPREPPAQKIYRREEDPEMVAHESSQPDVESRSVLPPAVAPAEEDEEQPKPTSLKDRIALLQKQQMEQAARQAEASQKKDKPKRPPKKRTDSHDVAGDVRDDAEEGEMLDRINSADTIGRHSTDTSRDHPQPRARSKGRTRKSKETTPVTSPTGVPRQFFDEANDADQSGAGDTEGEDALTGRDDSDDKPSISARPARVPSQRSHSGAGKDVAGDKDEEEEEAEGEEEEEDIDPEVKRRMEIRERMAKMSGGMGMAGMFGPPAGMSPMMPRKQKSSGSSDRKPSARVGTEDAENLASPAPPVPLMAMPGMQKVHSPEEVDRQLEVRKEEESKHSTNIRLQDSNVVPDVEDLVQEHTTPPGRAEESAPPNAPTHQDRSVPSPPTSSRTLAPSLPSARPVPPPPGSAPSIPRPAQTEALPLTPGYESDDELTLPTISVSHKIPNRDGPRPASREAPPSVPSATATPAMPSRRPVLPSRPSDHGQFSPNPLSPDSSPRSPTAPTSAPKRASHVPPIPGTSPTMASPPQNRAPPPPPPISTPASRTSTGLGIGPIDGSRLRIKEDSDEEVTEYEGDYDTDMAPGATHKDALKSQGRVTSHEESSTDDSTLHHHGLPSLGPPPAPPPNLSRTIPPPPPSQPPKNNRQSIDMPRQLPPAPPPTREQGFGQEGEEDYDPYKYSSPIHGNPPSASTDNSVNVPQHPQDGDDDVYSAFPPRKNSIQHVSQPMTPYSSPPTTHTGNLARGMSRQSLDVQQGTSNFRRSMDTSRPSMEHGFIAVDVDPGQASLWWAQANVPPPIFQNRSDMIYEIEESTTTRRGGKKVITKDVYALYMDYSQTVLTAHFEANNPSDVTLEQRHEPPPSRLRQDQLEAAHNRFGARIAESAGAKQNSVVSDGSPNALITNLLSPFPDALRPVGMRSYGALIYANLANASVQQFDEIRSGDVVTFRNAKFQGKHGPMHQKYSIEVGKQDHVGLVVDWDGTKKKVRAWEQGRDSKKVKMESFKLGDLRSGEVKVWRIMARSWVGWGR